MHVPHDLRRAVGILIACLGLCSTTIAQRLPQHALDQLQALQQEKASRTPAQQKLSSHLIFAAKMKRGQSIAPGIAALPSSLALLRFDEQERVLVDIKGNVNRGLTASIEAHGGSVIDATPEYGVVRAAVPLLMIEVLAERNDVQSISPAAQAVFNTRPVSQGDVAHAADQVRSLFPSIDGTGVKVCVLSNGVDSVASLQGSGDLPATVTVLSGQAGSGDEGTAMLEIVYDLAPGAQLFYATGGTGEGQMASNIKNLQSTYGCTVMVDDVFYFDEGVFQDGPISQAVNDVTALGVMYFSSAGNAGNLDSGTAGVWEGDFADSGNTIGGKGGAIHDFGGGKTSNTLTASAGPNFDVTLKWSDPLGGSNNDYDLYVFDSTGTTIVAASTTTQSGSQDPFEDVGPRNTNEKLVIVRASGATRALHLNTNRGQLAIGTAGNGYGHSTGAGTISIAAVNVGTAGGGVFTGGGANPVESYSTDGPRRIFYHPNGSAITPGNFLFSTNGGTLLQKPDFAAADCAASAAPGFNPFCGTSAAAPHAAAVATLAKSAKPSASYSDIYNALANTALDIMGPGVDRDSGAGIVMALPAVELLKTVNITIASSPSGLQFSQSGNGCNSGTFSTSDTLPWISDLTCSVNFSSPQNGSPGTRYAFTGWADGPTSDPRNFTVPSSPTTYTANFKTQYFLTTVSNPADGGSVSGSGWYDAGTTAVVTATPNPPFIFGSFSGTTSPPSSNPGSVLMNAPATATANFVVPTTTVVSAATVQYSDPVTLIATVSPVSAGSETATGSVQFFVNGNPVGTVPLTPSGVVAIPTTVLLAAGTYPIVAQFTSTNPYFLNSNGANILTVTREDATVTPSPSNPTAVKVNSPGGTAGPITLTASIAEVPDGSPGDISLAVPVTFTMVPIAPGTTFNCTATTSGGGVGGTLTASCTFSNVPVNVYLVTITIGGNYYQGSGQTILATYDPSLGFVTGGGTLMHNGVPANFGFSVKYLKNGNIQGGLLYMEHRPTGDVMLKTNSLGSLSIVGNEAILLSKATLNGVGNYSLQAIMIDNGEPGTNDQFGLQVKAPGGALVPDLTFAPITISGGNIQVPQRPQ